MSIFLGVLTGVLSFVPLFASLKASKHVTKTSNFSNASLMLLGVFGSILLLFATTLICYFCAKEELISFALSISTTLSVLAISFGIYSILKRNKAAQKRKNANKDKVK